MKRFIIVETVPCMVSWHYEVMAESVHEAIDLVKSGQVTSIQSLENTSPSIGDNIDSCWSGIAAQYSEGF
jgi:hypothetical protein